MIYILESPLVFSPHGTGDRYQSIILPLLLLDDVMTGTEDGAPGRVEAGAKGKVPDIITINDEFVECLHVCRCQVLEGGCLDSEVLKEAEERGRFGGSRSRDRLRRDEIRQNVICKGRSAIY